MVLQAQFIAFPGHRDKKKKLIFLTIVFDEVSLQIVVKLALIVLFLKKVRVILVEAKGTRSHLDFSSSPFGI